MGCSTLTSSSATSMAASSGSISTALTSALVASMAMISAAATSVSTGSASTSRLWRSSVSTKAALRRDGFDSGDLGLGDGLGADHIEGRPARLRRRARAPPPGGALWCGGDDRESCLGDSRRLARGARPQVPRRRQVPRRQQATRPQVPAQQVRSTSGSSATQVPQPQASRQRALPLRVMSGVGVTAAGGASATSCRRE